jgi:hypothetical protein
MKMRKTSLRDGDGLGNQARVSGLPVPHAIARVMHFPANAGLIFFTDELIVTLVTPT